MKKNVIISWLSGKDFMLILECLLVDIDYNVVGFYIMYVDNEVFF